MHICPCPPTCARVRVGEYGSKETEISLSVQKRNRELHRTIQSKMILDMITQAKEQGPMVDHALVHELELELEELCPPPKQQWTEMVAPYTGACVRVCACTDVFELTYVCVYKRSLLYTEVSIQKLKLT